ncbi:MAG: RNA methyltransferase, partial [Clostridia bacterium]|nr:RNA methyltransferase [Clostridia bacterium]
LAGSCCDVYAPKAVRAGMGAVFRLNLLRTATGAEAAEVLRRAGVTTFAAVAHGDAKKLHEVRLGRGCAILIGNEGNGLMAEAIAACDHPLTIPMGGRAESLNAAAAAAILIWEMVRTNEKSDRA